MQASSYAQTKKPKSFVAPWMRFLSVVGKPYSKNQGTCIDWTTLRACTVESFTSQVNQIVNSNAFYRIRESQNDHIFPSMMFRINEQPASFQQVTYPTSNCLRSLCINLSYTNILPSAWQQCTAKLAIVNCCCIFHERVITHVHPLQQKYFCEHYFYWGSSF